MAEPTPPLTCGNEVWAGSLEERLLSVSFVNWTGRVVFPTIYKARSRIQMALNTQGVRLGARCRLSWLLHDSINVSQSVYLLFIGQDLQVFMTPVRNTF